ncbi:tyrosine-type recombinase/integrase (plasmid) [Agrobacterium leguminum]|uniref:tyrosine-type recombinase/integrase n=1 Tax=Agrobacterium leguminum TaxID=2792015 RepID=UPI0030CE8555
MMMDQGYRAKSIRSTIQTILAFVEWNKDSRGGEPIMVTDDDLLRFLEDRAAADSLQYGERRSIQRLRAKLIEAGVLHQKPPASHPIDDIADRFAAAELDLAQAVPMAKNHRLASLPSFMSADQLSRVLAACDRTTVAGRRDFAILMFMSRLGLRAIEVALLSLDDIDWHHGLVQVHGIGGRVAAMPLPQDVGAAIADCVLNGRPSSGSRTIFHKVETPCTPFSGATPVILIAGRGWEQAYEHDAGIPRAVPGYVADRCWCRYPGYIDPLDAFLAWGHYVMAMFAAEELVPTWMMLALGWSNVVMFISFIMIGIRRVTVGIYSANEKDFDTARSILTAFRF